MNWPDHFDPTPPTRRWLGVAQRLLSDIERRVYAPGDSLPSDRALAPEFQVGRGTIREAILALELIGALETRHGSGTYVSKRWGQVIPELVEGQWQVQPDVLIEARMKLEPVVVGQACLRATAEDLANLRSDVEEAARLITKSEALPRFVGMGLRFHADLAELADNQLLAGFVKQLVDLGSQPMWVLLNQHAVRNESARRTQIEDHLKIIEALEHQDVDHIESIITNHLNGLRDSILGPNLTIVNVPTPDTRQTPTAGYAKRSRDEAN